MRAVIYTRSMEPITVMEIKGDVENRLMNDGSIRVAVIREIKVCAEEDDLFDFPLPVLTVRLRREWLTRDGERYPIITTEDDESALLLEAVFLPGQRSTLSKEKRHAFADGVMCALSGGLL